MFGASADVSPAEPESPPLPTRPRP
jgi:hypothetical protein